MANNRKADKLSLFSIVNIAVHLEKTKTESFQMTIVLLQIGVKDRVEVDLGAAGQTGTKTVKRQAPQKGAPAKASPRATPKVMQAIMKTLHPNLDEVPQKSAA